MYYKAGKLLKQLRIQQGLSQEKLVGDTMDRSNFGKIESGKQAISKEKMDALLEKLGYESARFFPYVLTDKEFEVFTLRDALDNCLAHFEIDKAAELVAKMETIPEFKKTLHRQYLLKSQATICLKKEKDFVKAGELLDEAIKTTIPKFEEKLVHTYLLATNDIEIINLIATIYRDNDRVDDAITLLKKLIQNIKSNVMDNYNKARSLTLVRYSLSLCLGKKELYEEELEVCNEAIETGQKNRVYGLLPMLIFNKAYCLLKLKRPDEIRKLLYQSYFFCEGMGIGWMFVKWFEKINFVSIVMF